MGAVGDLIAPGPGNDYVDPGLDDATLRAGSAVVDTVSYLHLAAVGVRVDLTPWGVSASPSSRAAPTDRGLRAHGRLRQRWRRRPHRVSVHRRARGSGWHGRHRRAIGRRHPSRRWSRGGHRSRPGRSRRGRRWPGRRLDPHGQGRGHDTRRCWFRQHRRRARQRRDGRPRTGRHRPHPGSRCPRPGDRWRPGRDRITTSLFADGATSTSTAAAGRTRVTSSPQGAPSLAARPSPSTSSVESS